MLVDTPVEPVEPNRHGAVVDVDVGPKLAPLADDLAAAALSLARRFSAGATMWCVAPTWPWHAHHVAVEFVHPVIMGCRALPAVVTEEDDLSAILRVLGRPGDLLLAVADADCGPVIDAMQRAPAWGLSTLWLGTGPRPRPGAADHVLWVGDGGDLAAHDGTMVLLYHVLWELTHVCFDHPGLLVPEPECVDDVCVTCSDEGRLAEVVTVVDADEARVRTATGVESVDTALVEAVRPCDLVLVHAGSVISIVEGAG